MNRFMISILAVIAAVGIMIAASSFYTVSEVEQVIVPDGPAPVEDRVKKFGGLTYRKPYRTDKRQQGAR